MSGKIAGALILFILILSLTAPVIMPLSPDSIDLDNLRQPPSLKHLLGTDAKGRDILARVLNGGKISISVAVFAAAVSLGIGMCAGLISGYFGGKADLMIMSAVDLILSFPSLLLAIGVSVLFSPGVYTVIIALSAVGWAPFARLIRGSVLSLKEESFIEAARAIGCGHLRILVVHIFPQCIPLSIVMAGIKVGGYILTEAALSFLGLGAQPPAATWGSMISANRVFIGSAPWMVISPGIMIGITSLSFNLLGDALRDKYDNERTKLL